MSRAYTKEEVRDIFIDYIKGLVDYWSRQESDDKLNGLAHSILVLFDGESVELPAIDLVLAPHEDDKEYCIDVQKNWFEPGMVVNDDCELHSMLYHNPDKPQG